MSFIKMGHVAEHDFFTPDICAVMVCALLKTFFVNKTDADLFDAVLVIAVCTALLEVAAFICDKIGIGKFYRTVTGMRNITYVETNQKTK